MMEMAIASSLTAARGPTDHAVRDQIVEAANECFAHYGYDKTTVADLAREIGFSKAYIYRFFESKQAIGEAICTIRLGLILDAARTAIAEAGSPPDQFRRMLKTVTEQSVALLLNDRKVYELTAQAAHERWASTESYVSELMGMIETIVRAGRESGDFERKTPVDETCRAILCATTAFVHPYQLKRNLDQLPEGQIELANLILRSLAK